MRRHSTKLVIFLIFSILFFSSCRDEVTIDIDESALEADTSLAALMQRTSLKDGSNDNIIDNANCFSIKLPVTVIVNGSEIIVDSEEDYEVVEDIFDEFDDDIDQIEIVFPITIIQSNFNERSINNQGEFSSFRNGCNGENDNDDDIECLDFKYPINVTVFNTSTEQTNSIVISNDMQMHDFIEELDEDDLANIEFPITVILFDGTEISVTSLEELENVIDNAKDDCDEDDDYDYDDDDCNNCTDQQIREVLTGCNDWEVDKLKLNNNNLEDNYDDYSFNFSTDGTVEVQNNSETFNGTWSSSGSGNNITISINISGLPDFNAEWKLHEIEQSGGEREVELRRMDDRLKFETNSCN